VKWDKLFEEFMPQKIQPGPGRETYKVTRPKSLEAKVQNERLIGLASTEETYSLILEFDEADRENVVKMLRDAADTVESLKR
jgi:hypothetical protein